MIFRNRKFFGLRKGKSSFHSERSRIMYTKIIELLYVLKTGGKIFVKNLKKIMNTTIFPILIFKQSFLERDSREKKL